MINGFPSGIRIGRTPEVNAMSGPRGVFRRGNVVSHRTPSPCRVRDAPTPFSVGYADAYEPEDDGLDTSACYGSHRSEFLKAGYPFDPNIVVKLTVFA